MQQQGFTLVELVVTVVVLVAVSMLAIPAFQSSIGNSQIRTVAESIKNGLQQARVEAIKRNANIRFTLQSDSSWQLGCQTATANCPAVIAGRNATEGSSANVTVTADSNTTVFTSFGTKDPAVQGALSRVDVTNQNVSSGERRALRILLAAGGYTRLCDPAAVSGDVRAC